MMTTAIWLIATAFQSTPVSLDSELRALGDAIVSTFPRGTTLLAVCGESIGKTYYLWPRNDGWVEDAISGGRIIFVASETGVPDVISRDAMGRFQSASKLGAKLEFTELDAKTGSFALTEIYKSGQVISYVVSLGPNGTVTLMWSNTRSHDSAINLSKVSAYSAICIVP